MITKEFHDLEVKTAYIRGYMAACEILSEKVVDVATEVKQGMLDSKFREFCDSHKNCNECLYHDLGVEDCQEQFNEDWKSDN